LARCADPVRDEGGDLLDGERELLGLGAVIGQIVSDGFRAFELVIFAGCDDGNTGAKRGEIGRELILLRLRCGGSSVTIGDEREIAIAFELRGEAR
jgi:hypothetical protein